MSRCSHGLPLEVKCDSCVNEALERVDTYKLPKSRKCCICKQKFIPKRALQTTCAYPLPCEGIKADMIVAKQVKKREADKRRETKAKLEAIKTLPELIKRAQVDFNKYINTRDANLPCIACGKPITTIAHASHYLSVGARPNLRFNELNVHRGCSKCNLFLHGNLINFRINLIDRIGLEAVEALESDHTPKNYTRDQVAELAKHYREKTRQLTKAPLKSKIILALSP